MDCTKTHVSHVWNCFQYKIVSSSLSTVAQSLEVLTQQNRKLIMQTLWLLVCENKLWKYYTHNGDSAEGETEEEWARWCRLNLKHTMDKALSKLISYYIQGVMKLWHLQEYLSAMAAWSFHQNYNLLFKKNSASTLINLATRIDQPLPFLKYKHFHTWPTVVLRNACYLSRTY